MVDCEGRGRSREGRREEVGVVLLGEGGCERGEEMRGWLWWEGWVGCVEEGWEREMEGERGPGVEADIEGEREGVGEGRGEEGRGEDIVAMG